MTARLFLTRQSLLSRARCGRVFATVLLGLQALLWGGGSIVEAKAAAESLSRYSHVEEQGSKACPPIHSHLDCLICRTLNGGGSTGSAPSVPPITSGIIDGPTSGAFVLAQRWLPGTLGSRAPPCA